MEEYGLPKACIYKKLKEDIIKKEKLTQSDKKFKTGSILPDSIQKQFPTKLFGVPIEEVDDFYKNEKVNFKKLLLNFMKLASF